MHETLEYPSLDEGSISAYAQALQLDLTFACQFEIRGSVLFERETEKFGLAEFKSLGGKHFSIEATSLDAAMRQASLEFNALQSKKSYTLISSHQGPSPIMGKFEPMEICVMDEDGAVIGLFTEGTWRKAVPSYLWEFMIDQASKTRIEAAREVKDYNLVEAQELMQHARYLDDMVELSTSHRNKRIFREIFT